MSASTKQLLIANGATGLYGSGLLGFYNRLKGMPFGVIVNYHNIKTPVMREEAALPAMYVHPDTFEMHVRYLAEHYQVVSMRELVMWKTRARRGSKPWCAITFDDGWRDNYDYALPILKKYGLPATVFISTDFIGSERAPWFYELLRCFPVLSDRVDDGRIDASDLSERGMTDILKRWVQLPGLSRMGAVDRIMEELKALPGPVLDEVVERLMGLIADRGGAVGEGAPLMLSWDQVREMGRSGIEIGSHGVRHWILTLLSPAQLHSELVESKKAIEEQLGHPVHGFAYPNGTYSDDVAHRIRAAGYEYGCTIWPGYVEPSSNPYTLNRLLMHNGNTYTTPLFACHMAGLFNRGRR